MEKFLLLPIACLFYFSTQAQDENFTIKSSGDSTILGKTVLDFAVPDIPAFKALGIDPSNILRPSSAKELGVVFSNLSNGNASVIPKNVAIEVAPLLIAKPWYSLGDYKKNYWLRFVSKARISLGTNHDSETGVNTIAAGLRATIFDKGDFRSDDSFQKEHTFSKMGDYQKRFGDKMRAFIIACGSPEIYKNLPEDRRKVIEDSLKNKVTEEMNFDLDKDIDDAIEVYKKKSWNAPRLDFAYSLLLQSPDSLINNVKLNKHLFWATWAIKPGKNNTWAQILVGINNSLYREEGKWINEFSGNMRFYGGTNRFKGLLEVQYLNIDHVTTDRFESLFTQIGIEASLYKGSWIHFSTGIVNALKGDNKSALKSNLSIFLTFPEDFHIF